MRARPMISSHSPQLVVLVLPAGAGRPGPGAFIVASYLLSEDKIYADAICWMHDVAVLVRDRLIAEGGDARIYRSNGERLIVVDTDGKILQDNEAEADLLG